MTEQRVTVTTTDVVPLLPSSCERLWTFTVALSLSAIVPVCDAPPLIA